MDRRTFLATSGAVALASPGSESAGAQTAQSTSAVPNPFLNFNPGLFCKTFARDANGNVDPAAMRELGQALATQDIAALERLPIANEMRLVSPLAASAWPKWKYASQVAMPNLPPAWDSDALADQALELYWMALMRDDKLVGMERSRIAADAARELGATVTYKGVTPATLFRPKEIAASQHGFAISQMLWMPVPFGAHQNWQAYKLPFTGQDFLSEPGEWARVQRGEWPAGITRHYAELSYIQTGRGLAEFDRFDFSYQAFLNAALILLGDPHRPRAALHARNPYKTARTQNAFATLGGAEILAMVARAADMALKAAWHVKWNVSGLLRPEEYGGLVEANKVPAAQRLKQSEALKRTKSKWGSHLLSSSYPEGAPAHPSFVSGHATIAGACATILKAFINPDLEFRFPVEPTRDGRDWERYSGPATNARIELDKLAANIAIGRSWAGIHWLSDSLGGLQLGEHVGLAVLREAKDQYAETQGGWFKGFEVITFDGKKVDV